MSSQYQHGRKFIVLLVVCSVISSAVGIAGVAGVITGRVAAMSDTSVPTDMPDGFSNAQVVASNGTQIDSIDTADDTDTFKVQLDRGDRLNMEVFAPTDEQNFRIDISSVSDGRFSLKNGSIDGVRTINDNFYQIDRITGGAAASWELWAESEGTFVVTVSDSLDATVPYEWKMQMSLNSPIVDPIAVTPPSASFIITPVTPEVNESVIFNASNSSDPDGKIQTYEWDFDDDGQFEATGPEVTHTYTTTGSKAVTLRVTDTDGQSATVQRSVNVTDQRAGLTHIKTVLTDRTDGDGVYRVGERINIAPKVKNGGPSTKTRPARVIISIDINGDKKSDISRTRGDRNTTVVPGGETQWFGYEYVPTSSGTKQVNVTIQAYIDGRWVTTDTTGWKTQFSVLSKGATPSAEFQMSLPPDQNNDIVVFTGRLVNSATGDGLANRRVHLMDSDDLLADDFDFADNELANATTNATGHFTLRWTAEQLSGINPNKYVQTYIEYRGENDTRDLRYPSENPFLIQVKPTVAPLDYTISTPTPIIAQTVGSKTSVQLFVTETGGFSPAKAAPQNWHVMPTVELNAEGIPADAYSVSPRSHELLTTLVVPPSTVPVPAYDARLSIDAGNLSQGRHEIRAEAQTPDGSLVRKQNITVRVVPDTATGKRIVVYNINKRTISPGWWYAQATGKALSIAYRDPLQYAVVKLSGVARSISSGPAAIIKETIGLLVDVYQNRLVPLISANNRAAVGGHLQEGAVESGTNITAVQENMTEIARTYESSDKTVTKKKLTETLEAVRAWKSAVNGSEDLSASQKAAVASLNSTETLLEQELSTVVVGEGATPTANDTFVATTPGESVTAAFDASVSGGGDLSYAVDTAPAHGSISIDGDQFTYTPESEFTGIDSFTYRATNAGGESDTGTVYVSVRPTGAAVIDGVVRDTQGDPIDNATVRVPLSGADLTTTTDAKGAFTLDLRDREHPSNVNVFVEATGYETITRIVRPADSGLLAAELTPVSESVLQLSSTLHHLGDGSYSGTINSQFQEPVEGSSFRTEFSLSSAQADPKSATLVYTARGVQLDNRIFVNGENVGTTAETAADGSLSERQLSLSPSTLQAGENTLRIEAAENWLGDLDDFELSSIRLRIETAGTVQKPPTARNVTVSTVRGSEVSGAFNATDPNADIESYAIETAPKHGSVTAVGGSFEYRPDAGFVGTDSFTYRVTDAAGNTDTATVEVVVEAGDTAPDFQVSALTAPATATVGDRVTATATVTNAGLTGGTQTVELTFDGSVVAARTLTLEPGQTGVVATSVTADSLGEFPVGVRTENDSRSTTVEFVNEAFVCGSSTGDPHFHTFDGTEYDFQGAGEFVLARSRGAREFEIQARHVPVGDSVSSTSAVATAIDGTEVTIDATDTTPLSVSGTPRSLDDGEELAVGDGVVRREGDTYTVVYPGPDGQVNGTDERFSATLWGDRLDVKVCLDEDRDATVEGLLGDLDGDPSDDIALADGTTLADPPTFDRLYGQFRSDWRVTESTSLFDYDAGESADSFYKPDFPERRVTVDDLDPATRDRAERRARDAGLEPGTPAFRNAVIDFALTNETDYVASATTTTTVNATGGGSGVSVTEGDLTGDGSRDIRLANGEVFFRIDGENVSGGLQVADVAGRVGAGQVLELLNALPTNPYSSSEKDTPTYEETVAFGVVADTEHRAAYRVVREYSYEHTGARVRIGWTLTLYNDSRYGIANLTITNVGSNPVEIDQDDGDIHDGIQVFDRLRLAGRSGTDSGYRFQLGDGDPRSFAQTTQWSTYAGTKVGTIYDSADAATVGYLNGTTAPHQWITEGNGGIGYHTDEVTLDPGATASWRVAVAMHDGGSDAPATGQTIVDRAERRPEKPPEVGGKQSAGPINASKLSIVPGGIGQAVPLSNAWHYKQRLNRSVEGYEPPVWVYVLADNADFDATPSSDLPKPYTIEDGDIVPRVGSGADTEPTNDVYLVYKPGANRSELKYLETRAGKDNSVVYGDRTLVESTDFAAENQVFYLPGVNITGTGDDFDNTTGFWDYVGAARRNTTDEHVVLTPAVEGTTGVLWFDRRVQPPFNVTFDYRIGGGTGADGLVFMFEKRRGYTPTGGGSLGFRSESESIPGYGIEFDNHFNFNKGDPSERHVGLIRGSAANHLTTVRSDTVEDNQWHTARVQVTQSGVRVWIDGERTLSWDGNATTEYGNVGFSAGTGARTHLHRIDDVRIDSWSSMERQEGLVARYDQDDSGGIDLGELGDAAADYARDQITISELSDVAAAYARS